MKTRDASQFSDNGNIRVLLVEDHPVVRESLKKIIQQEASLNVCGEADDCKQALALVEATKPHLVILDLTLKDSHGFGAYQKSAGSASESIESGFFNA